MIDIHIKTDSGVYDETSYQWIKTFLAETEFKVKQTITETDLTKIALIIQRDIINRRISGVNIFGNAYRPRTVKNPPLYHTGELHDSIFIRSAEGIREIYVGGSRKQIALYLQYGTTKMKPLPFFGISQEAQQEIENYLNNKMK